MGFLDTHDAFVDARRNWSKYNLGVDFDTAWHNYYDNHYDPDNLEGWADPVWSEEAWNDLVRENGGDPDLYKDDYNDLDTFGESVMESFDIMTATDIVSAMYDKYPEVEFVYEDGPKDGEVLLVFDLGDSPLDMEELTEWLEDCGADVSFAGPYMKLLVPEDEMNESLRTKLFKKIGCYSDGSPMEESLNESLGTENAKKIYTYADAVDPYDVIAELDGNKVKLDYGGDDYELIQCADDGKITSTFFSSTVSGNGDTKEFDSLDDYLEMSGIEREDWDDIINDYYEESLNEGFDPDKDYKITFQTTNYGELQSHVVSGKDVEEVLKKMKEHKYIVWPVEELDTNESLTEDTIDESISLGGGMKLPYDDNYCIFSKSSDKKVTILKINNKKEFQDAERRYGSFINVFSTVDDAKSYTKSFTGPAKEWPVEVLTEGALTEGAMTNGSYSLYNGWVKVPDKDSIPDQYPELEPEYTEWVNKAKDCETIDDIDAFLDDVYKLRQQGLLSSGEYGKENLIFKELRNNGFLQELKDMKVKLQNKEMSLEGLQESAGKRYLDTNGIMGYSGRTFTYNQLKDIWDEDHKFDPSMSEFNSFDDWVKETIANMEVIDESLNESVSLSYEEAADFFAKRGLKLRQDIFNLILSSNGIKNDMEGSGELDWNESHKSEGKEQLNEAEFDDSRAQELANYLGIDASEVEEGNYDNSYIVGDEEYYVLTYDEAEALAKEQVKEMADEMGLEGFSKDFQEDILYNYIDDSAVDEFIDEEADYFRTQENDEAEAERLEALSPTDRIEYIYDIYGPDGFEDWAKDYINWDLVAEEVVRLDGPENSLATYDGNEIQLDTYYAYRID